MSECALEATNFDNKSDFEHHSHRGEMEKSNLNVFEKSWWTADPCIVAKVTNK